MGLRKEKLFSFNTALKQLVKHVDMYNEYSTIETYRRGMVAAYNFRLKKKEHLNPPMNDNRWHGPVGPCFHQSFTI